MEQLDRDSTLSPVPIAGGHGTLFLCLFQHVVFRSLSGLRNVISSFDGRWLHAIKLLEPAFLISRAHKVLRLHIVGAREQSIVFRQPCVHTAPLTIIARMYTRCYRNVEPMCFSFGREMEREGTKRV